MAKKIKFALKMKDGIEVRTLKEFREAFALEQALAYFLDGKLLVWLEDRFYEEEAKKVSALENTDPELPRKLCDIFGVEHEEDTLSPAEIEYRNEKLKKLKEITDDDELLSKVDQVAFSQEELADLLSEGITTVYLSGDDFVIPTRKKDITYIGINTKLSFTSEQLKKYEENNIKLIDCCELEKVEEKGLSYIKKFSEREFNDVKEKILIKLKRDMRGKMPALNDYTTIIDDKDWIKDEAKAIIDEVGILDKYSRCSDNYKDIAQNIAISFIVPQIDVLALLAGEAIIANKVMDKVDTNKLHGTITSTMIAMETVNGNLISSLIDQIYRSTDNFDEDLAIGFVVDYFNNKNLNVDSYRDEIQNQVSCLFEQINRLIEAGLSEDDDEKISCIRRLSEREFNDVKEKVLVLLKNSAGVDLKLDDYVTQIDREVAIYSAKNIIHRCNIYNRYEKCPKYYKDLVTSVAIKLVAPDMDDDICRWGWVAYDRHAAKVNVDKIHTTAVSAIIKTECMNGTLVSYILDRIYRTLDIINVDLLVDYSLDYFKEQQLNVEAYRDELKNHMICLFEQISNSLFKSI